TKQGAQPLRLLSPPGGEEFQWKSRLGRNGKAVPPCLQSQRVPGSKPESFRDPQVGGWRNVQPSFEVIPIEDEDVLEEFLGSSLGGPRILTLPSTDCHEDERDILRCLALSSVVVLGGFALGILVSAELEPDLPGR